MSLLLFLFSLVSALVKGITKHRLVELGSR